jgi:peroxiredoxin
MYVQLALSVDGPVPLEEFLRKYPAQIEKTDAEIDGHRCVLVSVVDEYGLPYKYWLDVDRGFNILRYEEYDGRGTLIGVWEGVTLEEVARNVWYPTGVTCYVPVGAKDASRYRASLVKINQGLRQKDFEFEFPPGTRVVDERTGRAFTVGARPVEIEEASQKPLVELGKPAPELVLEKEAQVSLAQFKGKPVVLAFVSIYSRPCVKVLDEVKALQEKEGADKLGVIAVHDRTATPEDIEQFRKDHSITFPIVRVPDGPRDGWDSATFRAYGVTALPTVARIDTEGKVESVGASLR